MNYNVVVNCPYWYEWKTFVKEEHHRPFVLGVPHCKERLPSRSPISTTSQGNLLSDVGIRNSVRVLLFHWGLHNLSTDFNTS